MFDLETNIFSDILNSSFLVNKYMGRVITVKSLLEIYFMII